ncbi:MAG: chloride channel protein [Scytolyngbya sp. HA4215-MV1]|jgi:CIC family chloride channel protein|nr:chloride channel protein [Scytolyngbya sp. HA4215-MV1]
MRSFNPIRLLRSLKQQHSINRHPKGLAIFEACLIGLVSAIAVISLKVGVDWLSHWRLGMAAIAPPWLVLPGFGLIGGALSGWLIEWLAPAAQGSGVPQVKMAMASLPTPLNFRIALVKLLSSFLALGSGLPLGREGPTIQVGAAIACHLSHWFPTSPNHRRQLIAAGAGAGLSASFNTPIAGVLFVVEELLQDVSGFTLGTAILASFVGSVISLLLVGNSLAFNLTDAVARSHFSLKEIPFYLLLGGLAGLIGPLFDEGILLSLKINQRLKLGIPLRIGLAGLICGVGLALLPATFRNSAELRDLLTSSGTDWQTAAITFCAYSLFTLVASGSGTPGGLFVPLLFLGAALGYLVGIFEFNTLGVETPTTYAMAGMGAFLSAVSRIPITAIVLVFEMTADFDLVLPLMIATASAYLIAEKISGGSLYERMLAASGIHLKKELDTGGVLGKLTAADIMQRRVETLSSQISLNEAIQAFSRSHHRGFPVVDQGKLVGIVTQTDLATMQEQHLRGDEPLHRVMTPRPVTVSPDSPLTQVLYLLNQFKLSRLPVTEGKKLVGIITRADIIRAESDELSDENGQLGPQPEPSYLVYQTRAPASGQGRLLVPLSNPQTADALLQMAAAIARDLNYELECLSVIIVPRNRAPDEAIVRTTTSRRLLRQAESLGRQWKIPVHTQIRLAHDVAQAILETIKERHIDLILMGWKGNTATPGRIFGSAMDTIIRQASCEVVLVKLGEMERQTHAQTPKSSSKVAHGTIQNPLLLDRWLIPIAGGPNAQEAVKLLPALTTLSQTPEVRLCQIFQPSNENPDTRVLEADLQFLNRYLSHPAIATPLCAASVPDAIIHLAEQDQCDVIVLGASREGMLQQAMKGNIPEAIASQCACTVILVRGAIN